MVFGSRKHVVAAMAEHAEPMVVHWTKLLAVMKPGIFAITSIDKNYTPLMGSNVTDWSLTVEKLEKTPLFLSGTFSSHYETPDAAIKALSYISDWSKRGKYPGTLATTDASIVAAFDGFAAAIGKLAPSVAGNELTIAFDSNKLGGAEFFAGVASHFDKLTPK